MFKTLSRRSSSTQRCTVQELMRLLTRHQTRLLQYPALQCKSKHQARTSGSASTQSRTSSRRVLPRCLTRRELTAKVQVPRCCCTLQPGPVCCYRCSRSLPQTMRVSPRALCCIPDTLVMIAMWSSCCRDTGGLDTCERGKITSCTCHTGSFEEGEGSEPQHKFDGKFTFTAAPNVPMVRVFHLHSMRNYV